jgi:FPC/CPF motif-containing protein YcgG
MIQESLEHDPDAANWAFYCRGNGSGGTLQHAINGTYEYIRNFVEVEINYDPELAGLLDQNTGGRYSQRLLDRLKERLEQIKQQCLSQGESSGADEVWGIRWEGDES